jgi:hypothetical protein
LFLFEYFIECQGEIILGHASCSILIIHLSE